MSRDSIRVDDRAVAGMPIRLVVAIVVGATALGLLLPMLDGVERSEHTRVRAVPEPQEVVFDAGANPRRLTIAIRTADGHPVNDAGVVLSGHSLSLDGGPAVFETGQHSNEVTVRIGRGSDADLRVDFRPTQARGTIDLAVKPPPGGTYRAGESPAITVLDPEKTAP